MGWEIADHRKAKSGLDVINDEKFKGLGGFFVGFLVWGANGTNMGWGCAGEGGYHRNE
jgi:hypothetical protein